MRLSNFAYLVAGNLTERKGRSFTAVLVLAFSTAVVLAVASLSLGFLKGVVQKAAELFPPTVLTVKPKMMNVAMLSFNAGFIDQEVVGKIRDIPGVASASPQLSMKMPLRMEVEIAGNMAATDGVVVGVEPESVRDDIHPDFTFQYDEGSSLPIPVIVPRFLLDMYNLAYSDSVGLPKLNEDYMIGKDFKLHVGETLFMGGNARKRAIIPCEVVGLSGNPNLVAGVYIPLRHAEELNEWYTDKKETPYSAVNVTVQDLTQLDQVTSTILEMNLTVEGNQETYETIRFTTRAATWIIGGFAAVIVLISLISIINMFTLMMVQRAGETSLMQAVGASRRTVVRLYLVEAMAIGLAGSLLGVLVMKPLLLTAERYLHRALPMISYLPDQLFGGGWWLVLFAVAVVPIVCALAVLPVIVRFVSSRTNLSAAA